ncbi:MAG: dTDP-4-dehydrorhamnose 3,5-epimerase family protein [bacterium]|nr:dTDP-4-dehydrorhamnose 3,5-epimerase family protein [bacterium]
MIKDVKTKQLRVIPDERGRLMEVLRNDDELYIKFGQIYMTTTYPGVVKGWHLHRVQVDNIVAIKGMIKLVIYDAREDSPTHGEINEFFIGEYNPMLVQIPNGVYHGWKCISESEAIIINCPTEVYHYTHPDQVNLPPHGSVIPYDWSIQEK